MRTAIVSVFLLFLFSTVTAAQVPTSGNIFFGYSYYNTDLVPGNRINTNGWEGTLEGKMLPFLGIVADFSGHYGSQNVPIGVTCPIGVSGCRASISVNVSEYN